MHPNDIQTVGLQDCSTLKGLVVVIDVLRAFTTAAYAFAGGAEEILLVGEIEEALELQRKMPDALLIGEKWGQPIPGFHFGNSPVQVAAQSLKGKTLIQRTSAGTQGVVLSKSADRLLVSSFVVAEATYKYMRKIQFENGLQPGFVITGSRDGSEDAALAHYLKAKWADSHNAVDPKPFLDQVRNSPDGISFSSGHYPQFPQHDLEAACHIDRFSFAMEVRRDNGLHCLQAVFPTD
ncbi:MAG: 2-phosphosulfolactate phosphatase [Parachlamydia sp.]|nr:2-phosphosulfolactate phosphatase [Parachlamydia sp.]